MEQVRSCCMKDAEQIERLRAALCDLVSALGAKCKGADLVELVGDKEAAEIYFLIGLGEPDEK